MARKYKRELEEVTVLDAIACDYCKKVFKNNHNEKINQLSWQHHEWGNDSSDSIENRDVCVDCLLEFFKEAVDGLKEYESSGVVNDIPVEHIKKLICTK